MDLIAYRRYSACRQAILGGTLTRSADSLDEMAECGMTRQLGERTPAHGIPSCERQSLVPLREADSDETSQRSYDVSALRIGMRVSFRYS